MNDPIVVSQEPVLLVGGAHGDNAQLLSLLDEVTTVVAADSGADWVRAVGRLPNALIGDLDSVSDETRAALPPESVHRIEEQDGTDFDKAIRSISAPMIIGIGFLGGQVDHLLAAMTVLARYPDRAIVLADRSCARLPRSPWLWQSPRQCSVPRGGEDPSRAAVSPSTPHLPSPRTHRAG